MSMRCTICTHPKRLEIDRAIIQGNSFQSIAKTYNVDAQCISRHAKNHLSRQLLKHQEIRERINSERILDEVEDILARSKRLLRDSEADGQRGTALNAIREIRQTIEFLSKLALTLHSMKQEEALTLEEDREREFKLALEKLETPELELLIKIGDKLESGNMQERVLPDEWYEESEHINRVSRTEQVVDIEPTGPEPEQSEKYEEYIEPEPAPEPKPEPIKPKMRRKRAPKRFAKVYDGPGAPFATRHRQAKEYIREHGRLPREKWLRETL